MARSGKSRAAARARHSASATASDIKRIGWRGILELAHENAGQLTVTNHNRPQAVILTLEAYERLVAKGRRQDAATESALEELRGEFDERLAVLEGAEGSRRLRAASKGSAKLHGKVKAGASY